jgi:long-chain acyl-CoA synthetase
MQVALSIPLIRILSHPAVCGPVCASHGLDLQYFPKKGNTSASAHVGPPSVNIEAKLSGVNDTAFEKGVDPAGEVR